MLLHIDQNALLLTGAFGYILFFLLARGAVYHFFDRIFEDIVRCFYNKITRLATVSISGYPILAPIIPMSAPSRHGILLSYERE